MNKSEIKRKEKKETIQKAAFKLFREKGYADTKMTDIAKECGIAKGTIYDYFSGKDELVKNWLENSMEQFFLEMSQVLKPEYSARKKLNLYIEKKTEVTREIVPNISALFEADKIAKLEGKNELVDIVVRHISIEENMIHSIFEEGIKKGELNGKINIDLCTTMFIGALSFYMQAKKTGEKFANPILKTLEHYGEGWNNDMFFDVIYNGIGAADYQSK